MASAPTVGPADVESACSRLIIDFATHIDAMDYPRVLGLFAEDATLERVGVVLRGLGEIRDFLEKRPARAVTRHLCTNIRVQPRGDDRADGSCCVHFFQSPNEEERPLPLQVAASAVVEYLVGFVRQHGEWRIQDFRIRPVFQI